MRSPRPTRVETVGASGRGIVAGADIRNGEVIAEAPTVRLNADVISTIRSTSLFEYCFVDPAEQRVDDSRAGYIALGVMSLCNHQEFPNAKIEWVRSKDPPDLRLIATQDIPAGEEITLRYTNWDEYDDRIQQIKDR